MAACILSPAFRCMELRTSSFIMAFINLVVSFIFGILMLLGVASGDMIANNSDREEERRIPEMLTVLFITRKVHLLRMIVISLVLLVGLYENKRNLVRVYLIMAAISFFLEFSMFFVGFVHGYSAGNVVLWVTILGVEALTFLIVWSYYYYEMMPTLITA